MQFKKYVKESYKSPALKLDEEFFGSNIDKPTDIDYAMDAVYGPIKKMIAEGRYEEAKEELAALEEEVAELEAENSKRKLFRGFYNFLINTQKKNIERLRKQLPKNESIEDMDNRCEKCNTLLNDQGTCPK